MGSKIAKTKTIPQKMQTCFTKTRPGRELQLFYNRNINRAWSCKKVEVWFRCGIDKIYSLASFYGTIANIMVELITVMVHVKICTVQFRTRSKIEVIENYLPQQNDFPLKLADETVALSELFLYQ